ncbi:MAG: sigma-70 family RNA polymerase sigma factor [Pirellulaceae bacterium]|jgi:RNA polymerase sigma-70 factor (ECF subfamily)|nr:sigma-70 family RNA polymerase sigma factor [Pirellulaceae bacterium]
MNLSDSYTDELHQLRSGSAGLVAVFSAHRRRLHQLIDLRLDTRLRGRVDTDDLLQEVFLVMSRRLDGYLTNARVPPYVWFRKLALQIVADHHRRHLGASRRTATCEEPAFDSALMGSLTTPSGAAIRTEEAALLVEALAFIPEGDREILFMRHYENMSNREVAFELGVNESAASKRYVRALTKLRSQLHQLNSSTES